ncbi:MAG TPA: hypothetical protein PKI03_10965 [Pseudomonadota bacterium]|nr:hypothetical protein [Pseudomonadota bacterium]
MSTIQPIKKFPSPRDVRHLLRTAFPSVNAFNAFCLDEYPHIYFNFTDGMDRTTRENKLLESITEDPKVLCSQIIDYLEKTEPILCIDNFKSTTDRHIKLINKIQWMLVGIGVFNVLSVVVKLSNKVTQLTGSSTSLSIILLGISALLVNPTATPTKDTTNIAVGSAGSHRHKSPSEPPEDILDSAVEPPNTVTRPAFAPRVLKSNLAPVRLDEQYSIELQIYEPGSEMTPLKLKKSVKPFFLNVFSDRISSYRDAVQECNKHKMQLPYAEEIQAALSTGVLLPQLSKCNSSHSLFVDNYGIYCPSRLVCEDALDRGENRPRDRLLVSIDATQGTLSYANFQHSCQCQMHLLDRCVYYANCNREFGTSHCLVCANRAKGPHDYSLTINTEKSIPLMVSSCKVDISITQQNSRLSFLHQETVSAFSIDMIPGGHYRDYDNYDQASHYCKTQGKRLPLITELQASLIYPEFADSIRLAKARPSLRKYRRAQPSAEFAFYTENFQLFHNGEDGLVREGDQKGLQASFVDRGLFFPVAEDIGHGFAICVSGPLKVQSLIKEQPVSLTVVPFPSTISTIIIEDSELQFKIEDRLRPFSMDSAFTLQFAYRRSEFGGWQKANAYCTKRGKRLPYISELQASLLVPQIRSALFELSKEYVRDDLSIFTGNFGLSCPKTGSCVDAPDKRLIAQIVWSDNYPQAIGRRYVAETGFSDALAICVNTGSQATGPSLVTRQSTQIHEHNPL